jgi:hypothetical protein
MVSFLQSSHFNPFSVSVIANPGVLHLGHNDFIYGGQTSVLQIKNQNIADAYMRFFEELWNTGK